MTADEAAKLTDPVDILRRVQDLQNLRRRVEVICQMSGTPPGIPDEAILDEIDLLLARLRSVTPNKPHRETVLGLIEDLVAQFLYYDRKQATEWPQVGDIDAAVRGGEVTVDEMVDAFRLHLQAGLRR